MSWFTRSTYWLVGAPPSTETDGRDGWGGLLSCIPGRSGRPVVLGRSGGSKHTAGADDRIPLRHANRWRSDPITEDRGTGGAHAAPHGGRRPAEGRRLSAERGGTDEPFRRQPSDLARGGASAGVRAPGRGSPRLAHRRSGAGPRPRDRRPTCRLVVGSGGGGPRRRCGGAR